MTKWLKVFCGCLVLLILGGSYAQATEFAMKVGPVVKMKNDAAKQFQSNQLKFGLGFWGTADKPEEGGFTSGLLLEGSMLKSLYKFWFTPVFGYDFPIGQMPLTVTPNLGFGINYSKVKGFAVHEISVNIRPGVRARYNFTKSLGVFVEPAVFNFEPWRYNFGSDTSPAGIQHGSKTGLVASYEAGAGVSLLF